VFFHNQQLPAARVVVSEVLQLNPVQEDPTANTPLQLVDVTPSVQVATEEFEIVQLDISPGGPDATGGVLGS